MTAAVRRPGLTDAGAQLSDDGRYRYRLWRDWAAGTGPTVLFVMLNPSTADGRDDDPTIRRCLGFAHAWHYTRLEVVNLFGLRATDPVALTEADDPVGPGNVDALAEAITGAALTVAAWGASCPPNLGRQRRTAEQAIRELAGTSRWTGWPGTDAGALLPPPEPIRPSNASTAACLGRTSAGHPRHPLFVPGDRLPQPW